MAKYQLPDRRLEELEELAKKLFDPQKSFGNWELIQVLTAIDDHNAHIERTETCRTCEGSGQDVCPACEQDTDCSECHGEGRIEKDNG